ncbi:MAG: hypothetical protein ACTSSG_05150 [Candidatus Heimdallarchaeaceae archaeon]
MSSESKTPSSTSKKEPIVQAYPLDNAAILFSFVCSKRITGLFRLSASLVEPINATKLQQALDNIIERFPYFKVNLKAGLFWYYWETNLGKPKIIADSRNPCQEMPLRKKGYFPFRVRVFKNRVAVEFNHSLTDGTGALTFLKALVAEYLKLKGKEIRDWGDIFKADECPKEEEFEDSFKKNYKKIYPKPPKLEKAFHLPYKLEKVGIYHLTTGITPMEQIKKLYKSYNVTLTEFLSAIYLDSLQQILFSFPERKQKRLLKPIRLMIPVNLRRVYSSKTMRNFSLFVTPGIDPRLGEFSFEEILEKVYHYMRVEINDRYINQQIRRNVRGEIHPLMRVTPLFLKRLGGKLIYNRMGESLYSGTLTNLGRVTFPNEIQKEILDVQFIPAPSPSNKSCCAIVSFNNLLYINFGRVIRESVLERTFFRKLKKLGVDIKIETN